MIAIHSQALYGGWRRAWHRPRRASRLVERALAAVLDWRRRRRDRLQIAALDARISRDIETAEATRSTSTASKRAATIADVKGAR
jgi:hypothetical protein